MPEPSRIITARAPVRICDLGGWTDTWFAARGRVLNIAVAPGVEVRLAATPSQDRRQAITVCSGGVSRPAVPDGPWDGPDALLDAAIAEAGVPPGYDVEITVSSAVPPGSATGTSAAVTVALLAALCALAGRRWSPADLAKAAHLVETERLGLQSGVQDQLAAAHGGISYIEIERYPEAVLTPVEITPQLWDELGSCLLLVYLGAPHRSSEVHSSVISRFGSDGATAAVLEALRDAAFDGREALVAGDLRAFGEAMIANTAAQAGLHPELVSATARDLIEVAASAGAAGWKVNGAGGEGGSLSVLAGSVATRADLAAALEAAGPHIEVIPIGLSAPGVEVSEG